LAAGTDVRDITSYVRTAAERIRAYDHDINRRVAEAAIRAALGEHELIAGVGIELLVETHGYLLQLMAEDLELTDSELVDLIRQAEDLAESVLRPVRDHLEP
jgi:hypothetical protein